MPIRGSWNVLLSHPDVRYPAPQGYPDSSGWKELCCKGDRLRVQGVGTPLSDDTERALLSGATPSGSLRGHAPQHYPDMVFEWKTLTKVSKPCYSPRSTALQWCVRTPCLDIFAMDSKELSSISDCFGDKKAIKTPKLNTIWLELIARFLNMLIGLKGDNYYSKVFKRVNYKLWNNTFWVVIKKLVSSHKLTCGACKQHWKVRTPPHSDTLEEGTCKLLRSDHREGMHW